MLWLSARGEDPLSDGVHAQRGAEEEAAGGQLRLRDRGTGQTTSSRYSCVITEAQQLPQLLQLVSATKTQQL